MAGANPLKFLQEVRQEANKITWPTRQETMISTVMVLIMVVVASLFFLGVDWIRSVAVQWMRSIR